MCPWLFCSGNGFLIIEGMDMRRLKEEKKKMCNCACLALSVDRVNGIGARNDMEPSSLT